MGFEAFDYSVAMICFEKNKVKYGMSCAWAMQVDYDKLVCLLGVQSDTGNNIKPGDLIGVSAASKTQKDVVLKLGYNHSKSMDKFKGVDYTQNGSVILINNATRQMVCEVLDVIHLKGIEEDNLLYLKVVESKENGNEFLHYNEL